MSEKKTARRSGLVSFLTNPKYIMVFATIGIFLIIYAFGAIMYGSKGFTTPDPNEAAIKEVALRNSREPFVLCDDSKFGHISAVRFADFTAATIITNREPSINYQNAQNILIAK